MKVGVWFYGLGTALAGILDIAWRAFDASHEPIKSLGNVPGQNILACVAGIWLVAAGLAVLWRRSARFGVAASAAAYLIFVVLWLLRYYAGIHALGWRIDVLFGITFGLAQQLMLVAPAAIFVAIASADSPLQATATIAARWMLGLPSIVFGLAHLIGIHVFANIVPRWIPFGGGFWAVLTGIAFLLAGIAICSGIKDVQAAKLLALMLLLFEGLVELPPVFIRLHNQATWGAAVYNLAAIGACWMFAELRASSSTGERIDSAGNIAMSRPDPLIV